eukprot:777908_1
MPSNEWSRQCEFKKSLHGDLPQDLTDLHIELSDFAEVKCERIMQTLRISIVCILNLFVCVAIALWKQKVKVLVFESCSSLMQCIPIWNGSHVAQPCEDE